MPYWMPRDAIYAPVQAGASLTERIPGYQSDNTGDNISQRNARYSELTVLYWAWKNLDADYLGLAHYRRHFAGTGEQGILCSEDAQQLLSKAPLILPRKRDYIIETVESHYAHTSYGVHLDILRDVVARLEPDYYPALEKHLTQRKAHICNMLLARRDIADAYCSWLFPLLDVLDQRIDYEALSSYHARAVGRVAEYLLDVWLAVQDVSYVEVPMRILGPKNYTRRAQAFLAAKFLGKRYEI